MCLILSQQYTHPHTLSGTNTHIPLVSCLQSGGYHYVLPGCRGWCAWWRLPSSCLHCSVSGPCLCLPLCWCPGTGLVLESAAHWNTRRVRVELKIPLTSYRRWMNARLLYAWWEPTLFETLLRETHKRINPTGVFFPRSVSLYPRLRVSFRD